MSFRLDGDAEAPIVTEELGQNSRYSDYDEVCGVGVQVSVRATSFSSARRLQRIWTLTSLSFPEEEAAVK
jgi:hypothetical protein